MTTTPGRRSDIEHGLVELRWADPREVKLAETPEIFVQDYFIQLRKVPGTALPAG